MSIALILTSWVPGNPLAASLRDQTNRPRIADEYLVQRCHHVADQSDSGQIPPDRNLLIVLIECQATVLASIQNNPEYRGQILWDDTKGKNTKPSKKEADDLKACLKKSGVLERDLVAVLKGDPETMTRLEIENILIPWIKGLTKTR